jgi:hypothetical protein
MKSQAYQHTGSQRCRTSLLLTSTARSTRLQVTWWTTCCYHDLLATRPRRYRLPSPLPMLLLHGALSPTIATGRRWQSRALMILLPSPAIWPVQVLRWAIERQSPLRGKVSRVASQRLRPVAALARRGEKLSQPAPWREPDTARRVALHRSWLEQRLRVECGIADRRKRVPTIDTQRATERILRQQQTSQAAGRRIAIPRSGPHRQCALAGHPGTTNRENQLQKGFRLSFIRMNA